MDNNVAPSFGALLRRYRQAAGLTQEALAELARLSAFTISALERGVNNAPHADTVALLAEALQLPARERTALAAAARSRVVSALAPAAPDGRDGSDSLLIGRAAETDLLERHLAGEGPPVLLLAGEPGIGKTRLLREAARRATPRGWRVLEGGSLRQGARREAYAPLLHALERYIAPQTPARLRADLQGCAWLVRLLPELALAPIEPLPAWTLTPEQERRLIQGAVARFLSNVAGPSGTLLVLDDLQWAGHDALELVASSVRADPSAVRVVGAYRDTEVGPRDPLGALLGDLAHARLVTHRTLGPLSAAEADSLLVELLDGVEHDSLAVARERVVLRAGGVPFYVVSYAQGLRSGAVAEHDVPWTVAQGIHQRVAALSDVGQEVLGAATVAGCRVSHAVLTDVVARPRDDVAAAITEACRARLLVEDEDGYSVAHDVVREVVEADLGAARRALLHQRVAEALERAPGPLPVEDLAYHFGRAGHHEKAVLYLEQAGDRARARYANRAAEGFYGELVQRLDRLDCPVQAAAAREKWGAVLDLTARYAEALAAFEGAAAAYRVAGDAEGMGRALARIGRLNADRGMIDAEMARLRPTITTLEQRGPSPALAALYLTLAVLLFAGGRYSEQLAAAERSAAVARAVGAVDTLPGAEKSRGTALLLLGRADEGLACLAEAARLAEEAGDLCSLVKALNNAAEVYQARGDMDTNGRYLDRALALATQYGDPALISMVVSTRGAGAYITGDWRQARRDFEQAVTLNREVGAVWSSAYPLLDLGRLCHAEGEDTEAVRLLEESITLAERSRDLQALRQAHDVLAERDLLAGYAARARDRLARLLDRPQFQEIDVTFLLPTLAWAHLQLGDTDIAADVVAQALARARAGKLSLALVYALRVQALVDMRRGRWTAAERALEHALSLTHSIPHPLGAAWLLHTYGTLHTARGERQAARERLKAASAIFEQLGARADAERVQRDLARLSSMAVEASR